MQKTRKKTRPGQTDIAKTLGVSVSTVSRALAGSPLIKDSVKQQVRDAAVKIGYRIKEAQGFEGFERIVVLTSLAAFSDTRSSMYNRLLDGIRAEATRYGGEFSITIAKSRTPIPDAADKNLGPKSGCIFLGITPDAATAQNLADRGIPAVVCNGLDEELILDSISPANFQGAAIMARHLLELGHKKFLYLAGSDRATLRLRYLGFEKHIERHCDTSGAGILSIFEEGTDQSEEKGERFKRWIKAERSDATALFCFNDGAAVWAIEHLQSIGISVPDDISVVGFDDLPIAEISDPDLTTFRIDWTQIGRQTVQILHKRMISPHSAPEILQVSGNLITRNSSSSV